MTDVCQIGGTKSDLRMPDTDTLGLDQALRSFKNAWWVGLRMYVALRIEP